MLTKVPTFLSRWHKRSDKELAQTRASIAIEDSKPVREETTDRNPTYAWINQELAKAKSDLAAYQAQAAATQAIVDQYQAKSRDLDQKGIIEGGFAAQYKSYRGKLVFSTCGSARKREWKTP